MFRKVDESWTVNRSAPGPVTTETAPATVIRLRTTVSAPLPVLITAVPAMKLPVPAPPATVIVSFPTSANAPSDPSEMRPAVWRPRKLLPVPRSTESGPGMRKLAVGSMLRLSSPPFMVAWTALTTPMPETDGSPSTSVPALPVTVTEVPTTRMVTALARSSPTRVSSPVVSLATTLPAGTSRLSSVWSLRTGR